MAAPTDAVLPAHVHMEDRVYREALFRKQKALASIREIY
jgi:hypothetical protein